MSYVTRNLVPGETLLFETRHHWVVLLGPLLVSLLLGVPGVALLAGTIGGKSVNGVPADHSHSFPTDRCAEGGKEWLWSAGFSCWLR